MKGIHAVLGRAMVLTTALITIGSSRAQSGYTVTERGPDYQVLQKTVVQNGTNRVLSYVEMATGLNYTNSSGQLVESSEQITLLPNGGAAALQGRHQVYFPADIYNGVLEVITPDGRHLRSRPLGVSYDDGSNTVFIATLKDAVGYLTSSNTVTYRDAFTGIKADLVCQYRRGGFSSELVLRQQPPTPGDYGLDESYSTLQMVTEFFDTADPQQVPAASDDWFGLQDATLKFGSLTMTHGRAFAFKGTNSTAQTPDARTQTPVYKSWQHIGGRTFLIEQVPVLDLADNLNALPLTASYRKPATSKFKLATGSRQFPPAHGILADTNRILLAYGRGATTNLLATDWSQQPGVVLDYNTVDSDQTDFTFASGTTYLISGPIFMGDPDASSPTVIFQGGAVIKYTDAGGITLNGWWCADYQTGPGNPVVFTSSDDDSVGQQIDGSSGSPATLYDATFLDGPVESSGADHPHDLYFYYAGTALVSSDPDAVWNCRFFNCGLGINQDHGELDLYNDLFSGCDTAVYYAGADYDTGFDYSDSFMQFTVENTTADNGYLFRDWNSFPSMQFITKNSLFTRFDNPTLVWTDNGTNDASYEPSDTSCFQSAGNAHYYLNTASTYHENGTTNIDPALLAELHTLTTYAPQVGSLLDTAGWDIGFHYPVNEDSDFDGIPDAWIWQYFGSYAYTGTNLDVSGNTFLYDYQNTLDPNVIQFSVGATNDYVNHTSVAVQLDITGGAPAYYGAFVNSATTTNWLAFTTTNVSVSLGTTDGVYDVVVGLKGIATNATETWQDYAFTLDRVPPAVTITNPILISGTATVIKPYLQLQGGANKQLSTLSYDISNLAGLFTNQDVFVGDRFYDTNKSDFTTNYFQAYDVPLVTNGNWITLRLGDRAGNVTTTNFNVILDYSGATNPPALTLIWPQDGDAVSGTNLTIRGTMSDETGTLLAQVVNGLGTTNLVTNTITGIVERNNMFWLENVPLNGTNLISVQATDAAGNVTTTNFTLNPSTMTLTIDSTPTGDDLYNPVGTVSGRVSDPAAVVTVNGAGATVDPAGNGDGTYNWSAAGAPVDGMGTATFDATAADGGTKATVSGDPEMPAEAVFTYHRVAETEDWNFGATDHGSWSWGKVFVGGLKPDSDGSWKSLFVGLGNEFLSEVMDAIPDSHDTVYLWSNLDPTGTSIRTDSSGIQTNTISSDDPLEPRSVPQADYAGTTILGPFDDYDSYQYQYYAKNLQYTWHYPNGYRTGTLDAHSKVTLYTGGKASVARQNLFQIHASADLYPNWPALWPQTPSTPVDPTALIVAGKQPGADGNVWTVLPDNSPVDITVTATGKKHYNADALPTKYKLEVGVSSSTTGVELDPDVVVNGATYCVGQRLTFSPAWIDSAPPYISASSVFHWSLPGNYVNNWSQPYPSGSVNFFKDSSYLNYETTSCWYVDALQAGTASVGMILYFANGQNVFLSAGGKFNMYKPSLSFRPAKEGPPVVHIDPYLGQPMIRIGMFIPGFSGDNNNLQDLMAFYGDIVSDRKFPGQAMATQLINRDASIDGISFDSAGGAYYLDSSEVYPISDCDVIENISNTGCYGTVIYSDGPGMLFTLMLSSASINDHFETYFRFHPSGSDSIYVTLGRLDWDWNAAVGPIPGSWTITASGIGGPHFFNPDTEFPQWSQVLRSAP